MFSIIRSEVHLTAFLGPIVTCSEVLKTPLESCRAESRLLSVVLSRDVTQVMFVLNIPGNVYVTHMIRHQIILRPSTSRCACISFQGICPDSPKLIQTHLPGPALLLPGSRMLLDIHFNLSLKRKKKAS